MNPFVISPQEAQAIQEDEVQLVMALAQVSQRLAMTFQQSPQLPQAGQDDLRIQVGQRVVYGQLADGTIRRELNPNSLKVILDAIQQPVTPSVDPDAYRGKVPAIEIRDRGMVLFREERDGAITVNQIQMQIGETTEKVEPGIPSPTLNGRNGKTPEAPSPDLTVDPEAVAQIAAWLINPLNEAKPIYDAVAVGDYQIKQSGHHLSVSRDNQIILVVRDRAVVSNQLQDTDRAAFLELETRLSPSVAAEAAAPELARNGATPPAIAVLNQEAARLEDSRTKTLLKTTTENWQGQPLDVRVTQWLSQHLENRRNQQMARAVVELFQRGHERTGENLYQIGDYNLSRKGAGDYSLRDQRGELMQVRVTKSTGLGRGIEVVSVAERVSNFQRQELQHLRHNRTAMPQGKLDVEAVYAARTRRVEHTVRNFLQSHVYANTWNKEGGQFKLEVGTDDLLRITDKWGRGVVFERHHSNVVSRLNQQDLLHFERLDQRMQLVKQPTQRQPKAQMELG
ncbi:hypothetical protein IQ254_07020 [Nodosilinea sp. LEGE 07088]|uniref:hypothetical protein n=1 Tax=Nodosilinea sp. LEGE 07088 TaxID=2777968 RepID=UPI00187F82ED|nr:hypothetical protein [Nodosilinea sp. LEGE 07088]MBE9136954.1 hypothetical protein [Nodosilinea sp. LEGE 07088]